MKKQKANKIIRLSFRAKLLLSYFVLITIPLAICSVLIYKQFLLSYKETASTMVSQRISQEVNNINEALKNIESAAFMLSSNITFNTFLNKEYNSLSADYYSNMVNDVIPMFTWLRDSNHNINKIYVITHNDSISEVDMFINAARYEDKKWFKAVKKNTRLGLPYWEGYTVQRTYRGFQSGSSVSAYTYSMFCTVEPVYEKYSTYLEFQINPRLLYSSLNLSPVGESGFMAVLDNRSGIISDKQNPLLNSLVRDDGFIHQLNQPEGEYFFTFEKTNYKINYQMIQRLNAYILSVVPITEITELYYEAIANFIYSIAIMLVFLLILAYYLGNMLTKKIRKIANAFQTFQKGNFETSIEIEGTDELDSLAADFNTMASNTNALINKVYKAEIAQKQAEIGALQAQIKPHFIYNTLESLKMIAELHDEEEISDGLTALGNLMRQNTNTENHLIPIGTEVENLKDYISINNLIYNNRIKSTINIPEEVAGYSTLNLVLQPLVENCIRHGYDETYDVMEIDVDGMKADGCICLTVKDNGRGIEEKKLEKLKYLLERKAGESSGKSAEKGIGLLNVNRRIKLYFGDEYGVDIRSVPGKGTCAVVRIPALV